MIVNDPRLEEKLRLLFISNGSGHIHFPTERPSSGFPSSNPRTLRIMSTSLTTRRTFLTGCSLLATAAVLKPGSLLAASPLQRRDPFAVPGMAIFAQEVGTTFRVLRVSTPAVGLRLVEAAALPASGRPGTTVGEGEHRFSLLFSGPTDQPLTQGIHTLEHGALGRLALFLVPVCRPGRDHCLYESITDRSGAPLV